MVSGYTCLIGKAQQLELLLYTILLHFDIIVTLRRLTATLLFFGLFLLLEHMFILSRYWHQLFTIIISLCMLSLINWFLIWIINLGVSSFKDHFSYINIIIFCNVLRVLLQCWHALFSGLCEDLNCYFQLR